jgi:hypothetical protein
MLLVFMGILYVPARADLSEHFDNMAHFDMSEDEADNAADIEDDSPALREGACLVCPPGISGYTSTQSDVHKPLISAAREDRPPRA